MFLSAGKLEAKEAADAFRSGDVEEFSAV